MVAISPPSPTETRSTLADWLELQALMTPRGISVRASLLQVLDFVEDDETELSAVDPETGEVLDEAILEGKRHQFVDAALEELSYRQKKLGESYPFEVDWQKARLAWPSENAVSHPGQVVYLFCLLSSAIRERKLQPESVLRRAERDIAGAFQACACLAAGGYLNGDVSSFGFPRATGTNFLTALRQTFARFGIGTVRANGEIPDGLPTSLKDGGIDVIAWRDHPDGMPGKLYLVGQCASGLRWRDKSVVEYILQLGSWFTVPPAQHATPAMFIPFPFHHDIEERPGSYLEAVKNRFWHEESRFGVIFDRLRIAHFANACMAFTAPERRRVDGAERFGQVREWVQLTCKEVGMVSL